MTRFHFSVGAFALALTLAFPRAPAHAADAREGETLAKRWCATCHIVAPGQTTASADAPPFATIARQPGFDAAKLAFFLLDPHPKMPNMAITRPEAQDLAAYIASLR